MQRNVAALSSCPAPSLPIPTSADAEKALVSVSARVAELLSPMRTIPLYSDHGFEGNVEVWEPRPVTAADVPELMLQLASIDAVMAPGDPGIVLARVLALLAQYRDRDPLPPQVEAAIAEDWLDDVGEYPAWVVAEAAKRWRRHPSKYRFKPLPGDIRSLCIEISGRLPVVRDRLRRLLASVPKVTAPVMSATESRVLDVRSRVMALVAEKRMQ